VRIYFLIILCFIFFLNSSYAQKEEIGYVSDSFWITLRAGPGLDYKIIAFLKSGEPIKIISTEGDWTKVQPLSPKHKDKKGWVLSRFIIKRKPYKAIADELLKENTRLKESISQLETQLVNTIKEKKELAEKLKKISDAYQDTEEKYKTLKRESADFLSLKAKYENTAKKLKKAESKIEKLERENDFLKKSQAHRWFLMGAFVLFSGIIFGLIIGRQKRRRSIYYS